MHSSFGHCAFHRLFFRLAAYVVVFFVCSFEYVFFSFVLSLAVVLYLFFLWANLA